MSSIPIEAPRATGRPKTIAKCPTGIKGLDDITFGGLPQGRTTLVCGSAGCGKTLLGMEFLVRGALEFGEAGVCISFEETAGELAANVASLGLDVDALIESGKLAIDAVDLERSLIEEAGEYDLEALFVRLEYAIQTVNARRVVLDSIEALFAGLNNTAILRSELRRLFRWLKDRGLTAIITGERGDGTLTRHGLEEYISDCVILLDHKVHETVLTRRLRIVKYRGSTHGTNEYPFLIESDGISVLPVTSIDLKYGASSERVSTGVGELDAMLGGQGYFRGSSILVSGTAGTGKSSLSAHFLDAACRRGERCVMFSYEESSPQIVRNMRSIGIDLAQWIDKGLLHIHSARPTTFGIETHLIKIHKMVKDLSPTVVAIDPITALLHSGTEFEARSMLLRLIDFLKQQQITALMTTLTEGGKALEHSDVDISSLVNTWILLREIESGGERNRGIYILKARGLAHSNQIREFLLTDHGVELREVYLADTGLLTGSARIAHQAREETNMLRARQEIETRQLLLARRRQLLEARIANLRLELETEEMESVQLAEHERAKVQNREEGRGALADSRDVDSSKRAAAETSGYTRGGQS